MRCNRAPSSHHSVFSFDDLLCFGGAVLAVKLHPLINTRRRSSESFYAATFECVQSAGVALGLVEVILPPAHLRAVHAAGTRLACVRMFVLSTVPSFLCATQSTPSGQSTSDLCPVSAMAYQNLHPLCVCFVCASCVCLCVCVCLFVFCVDVCLYVFVCVCLCAFICFCFGPCVRGFFFFFFWGGGIAGNHVFAISRETLDAADFRKRALFTARQWRTAILQQQRFLDASHGDTKIAIVVKFEDIRHKSPTGLSTLTRCCCCCCCCCRC